MPATTNPKTHGHRIAPKPHGGVPQDPVRPTIASDHPQALTASFLPSASSQAFFGVSRSIPASRDHLASSDSVGEGGPVPQGSLKEKKRHEPQGPW